MTKQQMNRIKKLIKSFNAKNRERKNRHYKLEVFHYEYNGYAIELYYDLFYSTDFEEFVELAVNEMKLMPFLSSRNGEPYIHIV